MKPVLVIGATGFIGRHVAATLLAHGQPVRLGVRDPGSAARRFPGCDVVRIDMNRMSRAADWNRAVSGCDAVVNLAGILQSSGRQHAQAIHHDAVAALLQACKQQGIRRLVHVSAMGVEAGVDTEYARTRQAAETLLAAAPLETIILRPSLVYAGGSFGGTSTMRGLAGLPWITPLIGDGGQLFQPIHADDLADIVRRALACDLGQAHTLTLEPAGPDILPMRDILARLRQWLDLPPARPLRVPLPLVALLGRLGDVLPLGAITTTSVRQLQVPCIQHDPGQDLLGVAPRSMATFFLLHPSHVQDRWHARLVFLKPLLGLGLAVLWLASAALGLLAQPPDTGLIVQRLGLPAASGALVADAFSLLDLLIGLLLLTGRAGRRTGLLQLLTVCGYTLGLTLAQPGLWLNPYGPLLKNIPALLAILAWLALLDEK